MKYWFVITSVIGSAGLGWSGESCFLVGETGAADTPVPKPKENDKCIITIISKIYYLFGAKSINSMGYENNLMNKPHTTFLL